MKYHLPYDGPVLRHQVFQSLTAAGLFGRHPVWAYWLQGDVNLGATPTIRLAPAWKAEPVDVVAVLTDSLTSLIRCQFASAAEQAQLTREHRGWLVTERDAPAPVLEPEDTLRDDFSREMFKHKPAATWSRGKRDGDQRSIHLLRGEHEITARVVLDRERESASTGGVHEVSDGGAKALTLATRHGSFGVRRLDGQDWPLDGPTPVLPLEMTPMSWWKLTRWVPGVIEGPGEDGMHDGTIRRTRQDDDFRE